jgi:hypothetical protein
MDQSYIGLFILIFCIVMVNVDLIIMSNNLTGLAKISIKICSYYTKKDCDSNYILETLNESERYNRKYIISKGSNGYDALYEKISVFFVSAQFSTNQQTNLLNQSIYRYIPIVHYIIENKNGKTKISEYLNIRIITIYTLVIGFLILSIIACIFFYDETINPLGFIAIMLFIVSFWFMLCRSWYKTQKYRLTSVIDIQKK